MRLRTLFCLIAPLALPVMSLAQDAVPAHREPRHKLVLDSVRFRVLDVQIPPRDTTRFHIHDTAILYVDLAPSTTNAQLLGRDFPLTPASAPPAAVGNVRVDSAYVLQPVTHRVTNVGAGMFRLLAITSSGATLESSMDGSRSLPGAIELRSTWFHQARVQLRSRSVTEWFLSPGPVLVVQPLASGLGVEYGTDARRTLDGAGSWFLVPAGVRYRITNDGSDSATAVAIQIR